MIVVGPIPTERAVYPVYRCRPDVPGAGGRLAHLRVGCEHVPLAEPHQPGGWWLSLVRSLGFRAGVLPLPA